VAWPRALTRMGRDTATTVPATDITAATPPPIMAMDMPPRTATRPPTMAIQPAITRRPTTVPGIGVSFDPHTRTMAARGIITGTTAHIVTTVITGEPPGSFNGNEPREGWGSLEILLPCRFERTGLKPPQRMRSRRLSLQKRRIAGNPPTKTSTRSGPKRRRELGRRELRQTVQRCPPPTSDERRRRFQVGRCYVPTRRRSAVVSTATGSAAFFFSNWNRHRTPALDI